MALVARHLRSGSDFRRLDFFFSSRRRHTRLQGDWSSDVCSSDLFPPSVLRDSSSPCLIRLRSTPRTRLTSHFKKSGRMEASDLSEAWPEPRSSTATL